MRANSPSSLKRSRKKGPQTGEGADKEKLIEYNGKHHKEKKRNKKESTQWFKKNESMHGEKKVCGMQKSTKRRGERIKEKSKQE